MKVTLLFSLVGFTLSAYSQPPSQSEKDSIAVALWEKQQQSNIDLLGNPFPDFQFADRMDSVDNDCLKGKIVFVNFWFAACAPCVAEFDALNEMYDELKTVKNFEFISFTFDTRGQIEKTRAKYNIQYKVFSIPKPECYRLNNNNGFPTSMIIDPSGIIKYRTKNNQLPATAGNKRLTGTMA